MSRRLGLLFYAAAVTFSAHIVWGAFTYRGLYRIVLDWEVARFGVVPGLAIIGPITVVAVPLWFCGMMANGSLDPARRASEPSRTKGMGCMTLIGVAGVVLSGIGVASGVRALHRPTLADPPRTIDLATLGAAEPPTGHVRLVGTADNARTLAIVSRGKAGSTMEDSFTPVLPRPTAAKAPIRFLLSGHRLDPAGPPPSFTDDPEGLLTVDVLPPEARTAFVHAGVVLDDPLYVLDTTGIDATFDDWVKAVLYGLGGLACLGLLLIPTKRKAEVR